MNTQGECFIRVEKHFVYVKLGLCVEKFNAKNVLPKNISFLIPIMKKKVNSWINEIEGRDVLLSTIIKSINGIESCDQIADTTYEKIRMFYPTIDYMKILIYKKLLELEECGVIFFTDLFSMTNIYMLDHKNFFH